MPLGVKHITREKTTISITLGGSASDARQQCIACTRLRHLAPRTNYYNSSSQSIQPLFLGLFCASNLVAVYPPSPRCRKRIGLVPYTHYLVLNTHRQRQSTLKLIVIVNSLLLSATSSQMCQLLLVVLDDVLSASICQYFCVV